jgi:hypothetical protein
MTLPVWNDNSTCSEIQTTQDIHNTVARKPLLMFFYDNMSLPELEVCRKYNQYMIIGYPTLISFI